MIRLVAGAIYLPWAIFLALNLVGFFVCFVLIHLVINNNDLFVFHLRVGLFQSDVCTFKHLVFLQQNFRKPISQDTGLLFQSTWEIETKEYWIKASLGSTVRVCSKTSSGKIWLGFVFNPQKVVFIFNKKKCFSQSICANPLVSTELIMIQQTGIHTAKYKVCLTFLVNDLD